MLVVVAAMVLLCVAANRLGNYWDATRRPKAKIGRGWHLFADAIEVTGIGVFAALANPHRLRIVAAIKNCLSVGAVALPSLVGARKFSGGMNLSCTGSGSTLLTRTWRYLTQTRCGH